MPQAEKLVVHPNQRNFSHMFQSFLVPWEIASDFSWAHLVFQWIAWNVLSPISCIWSVHINRKKTNSGMTFLQYYEKALRAGFSIKTKCFLRDIFFLSNAWRSHTQAWWSLHFSFFSFGSIKGALVSILCAKLPTDNEKRFLAGHCFVFEQTALKSFWQIGGESPKKAR